MIVKLYLPYNTYDDGDFDSSYQMSDDEYFDRINKEEERSKTVHLDLMNKNRQNYANTASFGMPVKHDEKVKLSMCEVSIADDEGKDIGVDGLVEECVKQDVGAMTLRFNLDDADDEFLEDVNLWSRDHEEINQYMDKMGEDWVFRNEPIRNFKGEYVNKANEVKYFEMHNCRIFDKTDACTFVVIYDKITFINSLN